MKPRWLGPYIIEEDLGKGVFKISSQKTGVVLKKCVNQCRLKLFHTASQPEPASSQPTSLKPANLDSPATSQPLLGSTPTNLPPNTKTDSNSSQPTSLKPANLESPHSPATSQPLLTSTPIKKSKPDRNDSVSYESIPPLPSPITVMQPGTNEEPTSSKPKTWKRRNSAAYARDAKWRQILVTTSCKDAKPYDVDTHVPMQPSPRLWKKDLGLTVEDKQILRDPSAWLTDNLIDAGQILLRKQYGDRVSGLQDVVKARTLSMDVEPDEFIQILNKSDSHWFTISTIGCQPGVVNVFDSGSKYTTDRNKEITALLNTEDTIILQYMSVQLQSGVSDCGLFALFCHCIMYGY